MREIIKASSNNFFENVAKLIENVRSFVGRTADLTMSITYFEIGRMIVEEEQGGAARAEYGRGLLEKLAVYLTERYRMYPSQDVASRIGNLIALPLQGQVLASGNSAFVDENWNAYPDQWKVLLEETEKLSLEDIEKYMSKSNATLTESDS